MVEHCYYVWGCGFGVQTHQTKQSHKITHFPRPNFTCSPRDHTSDWGGGCKLREGDILAQWSAVTSGDSWLDAGPLSWPTSPMCRPCWGTQEPRSPAPEATFLSSGPGDWEGRLLIRLGPWYDSGSCHFIIVLLSPFHVWQSRRLLWSVVCDHLWTRRKQEFTPEQSCPGTLLTGYLWESRGLLQELLP